MLRADLGDGLALRPFAATDLPELHALIEANRDRLRPWMAWADQEEEATAAFLAEVTRSTRDVTCAITLDGRIVGTIGLAHPDGIPMVGYWLTGEAVGRGIMTRALSALLDHAFGDLGVARVELHAARDNARSRAVAERAGFRPVRTIVAAAVVDGRSVDHVVYALSRAAAP